MPDYKLLLTYFAFVCSCQHISTVMKYLHFLLQILCENSRFLFNPSVLTNRFLEIVWHEKNVKFPLNFFNGKTNLTQVLVNFSSPPPLLQVNFLLRHRTVSTDLFTTNLFLISVLPLKLPYFSHNVTPPTDYNVCPPDFPR